MPNQKDLAEEFFSQSPFPLWDEKGLVYARRFLIAGFKRVDFKKMSVLDIGCGTGLFSTAFAQLGADVDSIDISLPSIEFAKDKMKAYGLKINYFHCDLFKFTSSKKYDIVFANGVLHHTSNPLAGFNHCAKMLSPNGYIIVGFYNKYEYVVRVLRFMVNKHAKTFTQRWDYIKHYWLVYKYIFWPYTYWFKSKDANTKSVMMDFYANFRYSYQSVNEIKGWMRKEGITYLRKFYDYEDKPFFQRVISRFHPYTNHFITVLGKKNNGQ